MNLKQCGTEKKSMLAIDFDSFLWNFVKLYTYNQKNTTCLQTRYQHKKVLIAKYLFAPNLTQFLQSLIENLYSQLRLFDCGNIVEEPLKYVGILNKKRKQLCQSIF